MNYFVSKKIMYIAPLKLQIAERRWQGKINKSFNGHTGLYINDIASLWLGLHLYCDTPAACQRLIDTICIDGLYSGDSRNEFRIQTKNNTYNNSK